MKKHWRPSVCYQPLINKRNTHAVSWITSAWAWEFGAVSSALRASGCSDLSSASMAGLGFRFKGHVQRWPSPFLLEKPGMVPRWAVWLIVLFLFLPIFGFFPGESMVCARQRCSPRPIKKWPFWIGFSCSCFWPKICPAIGVFSLTSHLIAFPE